MDFLATFLAGLNDSFLVKFMLSPLYVAPTVLIAWLLWLRRGRPSGFFRYLLPKDLYLHPSTMVDLKVALFNTFFLATGVFSVLWVTPYVIVLLQSFLSGFAGGDAKAVSTGLWQGLMAGILLFLTQDFCRFWNHYLHHETRFLWPFHAVHHSAEVMTPLTFLRAHPICYALQSVIMSAATGLVQGLILFVLIGPVEPWVYFVGVWAFNAYIFFGSHLRHSHIWVSYGPVLEHILISPAQHQVHHSSDPKHHDKNYGEVFAIWDWIFGTLYVPDGQEDRNRPEMREIAYRLRINKVEEKAAVLDLLPSIRAYAGLNYDTNQYLLNDNWTGWGARVSWDLIGLTKLPRRKKVVAGQEALLDARALALTQAIATQVYVSNKRFHNLQKQTRVARQNYVVSDKIFTQAEGEYTSGVGAEREYVQENLNSILASLRYDATYAEMQGAFSNVYASVGLDAYDGAMTGNESVEELANSLRGVWRNRGDKG